MLMLSGFFINASILISSLFVGYQLYKNKLKILPPLEMKLIFGIGNGILGIILMHFTIYITETMIIDLRHLVVILAALYGGLFSSMTAASIIAAGRITSFGINPSSITAAISILVIGIGCGIFHRFKINVWKKWIYMSVYSLIIVSIALFLLIKNTQTLFNLYPVFWGASLAGGFFVNYFVLYLQRSHERFKQFKEYSTVDFLTGLNNTRLFDSVINKCIAEAIQNEEIFSLLLIDIDFFKKVNDTYGHPAGDAVLKELGRILLDTCRTHDSTFRIGGEEFSVLLPKCNNLNALEIAVRIRDNVQHRDVLLPGGISIHITVSIGVVTYSEFTGNREELVRQADDALYEAKQSGRNRVCSINGPVLR